MSGSAQIGWKFVTADDVIESYNLTGKLTSVTTRAGLVTTITYDASENLNAVTGPFGHTLTFEYDTNKRVRQVTAPDGGVYNYAYDVTNNLSSVTYPNGLSRRYVYENTSFPSALTGIIDELGNRFATYSYDLVGRASSSEHAGGVERTTLIYNADGTTSATDARGNVHGYGFTSQFDLVKPTTVTGAPVSNAGGKAFTYDINGFIASRMDWNGNIAKYAHDARGNQTSRTEAFGTPLARTIATEWHPTFHLPNKITEPGRVTDFAYDTQGNLRSKTVTADAQTRSWSYTYNAFGQVKTATDPRGFITTYDYDAKGNLASVTNPLGHVTSFTDYDGAGRLLRAVDPNGTATTLTYDPLGRLTSRAVGGLNTRYYYDAVGNLQTIIKPDSSWLYFIYDAAHRLKQVYDPLGNHVVYTLDAASNRTKEELFDGTNVLKQTRSYDYDSVNRLSRTIGAQGQTTIYGYDSQGNLTSITDPLNHLTRFGFDALNRLAGATDPNGGVTSFGYEGLDHLTSVTDPRSLTTAYDVNGLDDQKSVTSPDTGTTTKTYDLAGNVLTTTDGRGAKTTYAYDALNRRTSATFADGSTTYWQYDQGANGKGRLTRILDATGSTSYTYDAVGHLTGKQQVVGVGVLNTLYGYDYAGRLSQITYPSGKRVGYAYDGAGRISGITVNGATLISGVGYHPFGGPNGWTQGNQLAFTRNFDLDGRVNWTLLSGIRFASYAFDAASRITASSESGLGNKTFDYDALDRLKTYAGPVAGQSFDYDASGNRVSAILLEGATTNSFTYSIAPTSNRLTSISGAWGEQFSYDAAGNTLTHNSPSGNYSFFYDARGRMAQARTGALAKNYWINGLGQRVLKVDPANASDLTYFAYDEAGHLIAEYSATGAVIEETVWLGDLPVATLLAGGTYYIAPDHLGAPHQITNASQKVVWLWDHDPFGAKAPSSSPGFVYNLRFPGQYYDAESGLNYNYFRNYDPKIGRYIESDPIGLAGGIDTYGYVGGNPILKIDPFGMGSSIGELLFGTTEAAAVVIGTQSIPNLTQLQSFCFSKQLECNGKPEREQEYRAYAACVSKAYAVEGEQFSLIAKNLRALDKASEPSQIVDQIASLSENGKQLLELIRTIKGFPPSSQ